MIIITALLFFIKLKSFKSGFNHSYTVSLEEQKQQIKQFNIKRKIIEWKQMNN